MKDLFGVRSAWMREGTFAVKRVHGGLLYSEQGSEFLVDVVEGNGFSMVVENMCDADQSLKGLSMSEQMRIAKNIKSVLLSNGLNVDLIYEHRVVLD